MRKFLSVVGGLFLVLVLTAAVFYVFGAIKVDGLNRSSKAYVERTVPAITSNWSRVFGNIESAEALSGGGGGGHTGSCTGAEVASGTGGSVSKLPWTVPSVNESRSFISGGPGMSSSSPLLCPKGVTMETEGNGML